MSQYQRLIPMLRAGWVSQAQVALPGPHGDGIGRLASRIHRIAQAIPPGWEVQRRMVSRNGKRWAEYHIKSPARSGWQWGTK